MVKTRFFGKGGWWRFYLVFTIIFAFVGFNVLFGTLQNWGSFGILKKVLVFIPFFVLFQIITASLSVFLQEKTATKCVRINI